MYLDTHKVSSNSEKIFFVSKKNACFLSNKTSESGPGISFIGVTMGPSLGDGEDKLSIFVEAITPGGPVDLEGSIKVRLSSDVC